VLWLQRVAIVCVLFAGMATAYSVVDRNRRPTERSVRPVESTEARSVIDVPHGIRDAELSRRAHRPKVEQMRKGGLSYDGVLVGWKDEKGNLPRARPAEPMPSTSCRSVERAQKGKDDLNGPYRVHDLTNSMFEEASGFGFVRMLFRANKRGVMVSSPAVDRVELVSLLTEYEPSVYVLDEMATPALARQAKRRRLDEFEERGLEAVRRGENLVWTREAPTRMFGAIRARKNCLECHVEAKEGELLGAFTYYLTTPVDQLAAKVGVE